ncbi:MAG TPA: DUF4112 domain-containing protein [Tepidisphaeraceae bacterium]|nr:DUF4112 domain-containing protein [Tepidisphaeraceae bacterium]
MMSAIPVDVQRVAPGQRPVADLGTDLERVRKMAKLLDAQFEIAGIKVGWDAIIGLVPVAGDVATALIGVYPLHVARKHKLGRTVQARMAANLLIDWAVGAIPVVGDLFDIGFKANLKNLKLLEKAAAKRGSV